MTDEAHEMTQDQVEAAALATRIALCPDASYHNPSGPFRYCHCGWMEPDEVKCTAHVDVDLIRDDIEGPIPHSFPCTKRTGHDGVHSATVTWLDGEDES